MHVRRGVLGHSPAHERHRSYTQPHRHSLTALQPDRHSVLGTYPTVRASVPLCALCVLHLQTALTCCMRVYHGELNMNVKDAPNHQYNEI